ncbi:MAG: dockerin type I repeat-containing protein [Clostridia bacterium]|nr:dockerin type I repeat-containing protein [Clostridia bacterium]
MKKRLFSILLTLCMVLMLCPVTAFAEELPGVIIGDLDFDGNVTEKDAVHLRNYLEGLESFTDEELKVADFNGDGVVNDTDLTELQSYLDFTESGLTIDGPDVVCKDQDYEFTVTPPEGVTLDKEFGFDTGGKGSGVKLTIDKDGVGHGVMSTEWYDLNTNYFDLSVCGYTADRQSVSATKRVRVSQEHIYVDGVCGCGAVLQYIVEYDGGAEFPLCVDFKTHGRDLTLRGKTFTMDGYVQTGWVDKETGAVYKLGGTYSTDADVTLNPVFDEIITLTVPFTTTVKLGGNVAPGETTFDLAIVGANVSEENYADVRVSGSVTTNGAGDYEGTLTLTGPEGQLWEMLCEGAFVQQVNAGADGWTVDDTVYGLLWQDVAELATADTAEGITVLILPVICEEGDDGVYYDLDWNADPLDEMTFTNTYTKNTVPPEDPTPPENPTNTGDNSNSAPWLALLAVSAAGMIGTGVYSKRRRASREK